MNYPQSLKQLVEIAEKRDKVHTDFVKHILLMASGLLGIIVSLHKASSTEIFSKLSFGISVCSLSLGIIFLSISLSIHLYVQRSTFMKWKKEMSIEFDNPAYKPKAVFVNPSKWFGFCEKLGYISLCVAIIALSIYAIIIA